MSFPVYYANAYTVSVSNQEVLIDFKMVTPENRDPNRPETINVRIIQTIRSAEVFRGLLNRTLPQTGGNIGNIDIPPRI